jgi:hypothetical protein
MEKDRWNLQNTFIDCKIRLGKQSRRTGSSTDHFISRGKVH